MRKIRKFEFKRFLYLLSYILLVSVVGFGISKSINKLPEVLSAFSTQPKTVQKQVILTKVVDGDTVKVLIDGSEQTIRLIGINAPEMSDCRGAWGGEELNKLLENQTILLEDDPTQGDKDKYNRLLRYIHTETGQNINGKMVEIGAAKEYTYDKDYKYKDLFVTAQNLAKQDSLGVWGVPCDE
ncbi:hypothetical protein A2380_03325 [candidate division WWE3 bacterium RIFOXYB1_FULL_43_24]|uniref:Nuclease (SNase domain protein) n=2 Tax=Katanobacteria TaxID=422282 RepID=A0A0G1BL43_UNCKA|nr:MAG: Nuclease (SNase domain protein) [candidate division WWE3 bacterium GW2011_GWA1_42_12]KKS34788.1 MAG: Nuclease (SNase domain protein) [candidate division WWE3 bacterium GW2011_GWD1_42_14]KKS38173.1 MAG: Nuclease (SNase domain protein) [candidate division WWE3 bacterium GW2011_GWF1_42_14]KKS40310.1 MAG: Nuclease (SNase domain protein) [candidate division WWE3 bacterium GW2011_GWE1_42_16]KKS67145.1 MAG: Nuclease (SNase domain protein) [candidate division WWE3 bacterium GW2011_GWB1_42_6]OG